jgi:hypothetical protein
MLNGQKFFWFFFLPKRTACFRAAVIGVGITLRYTLPWLRHDLARRRTLGIPFFAVSGASAGQWRNRPMTRYYRGMLTATLLAGLALPAFAQTPAPAAPIPPAAETSAPAPDTSAPAKDMAAPDAKKAKPAVHKHHHVAAKHKSAAADTKTTPPGQSN